MRLPNKKKPGDPIMAGDWNVLLDAIAARTPRPGDGLKFISSSGGFAYSCPGSPSGQPGHPPFSVIGIAKAGASYKVTIKEGWVIERLVKSGTSPAVKFWIPKYSGTALNATPRPELAMSLGDTAFCRVQCAVDGLITGDPTIMVSSATQNGQPYWPADPDASGQTGDYYVKLFTLASDGGTPTVTVYQQSDVEHWAQLWTGKNVGAEARVFKEHDETDNKYAFRTIRGEAPLTAEEDGDIIKVYIDGGANMNVSVVYASFDGSGHKVVESREVACVIYVRNGIIIGITDPQDNAPNLIEVDVSLARDVT